MSPRLPGPLLELLVIGLGNVTHPYTRHSAGHTVVDSLASKLGISLRAERGYVAGEKTIVINGFTTTKIILAKTKPLMNISGRAVTTALRTHVSNPVPASMIVVHDSLDHKTFTVSSKFGGSASGHNGIKSVIEALGGNKDFHRLRIGIGRPNEFERSEKAISDYVLGRMTNREQQFWSESGEGADLVWKEIEKIIQSG